MTTSVIKARLDRPIAPFVPRRLMRNGHLQTLAGNFLPRSAVLPAPEVDLVEVVPAQADLPASRVLCHSHWQPDGATKTVLLLHGLEGSSNSQYMRGNAARFCAAGWNVVRMNMRNCGGTEQESPTLYHSGLSQDINAVMQHFDRTKGATRWALVGYSMGGNLVLKLAGELGESARQRILAVAGVSPVIDLGPSADALHEPLNRIYEWKFLRGLIKRYARKCELFPKLFDPLRSRNIRSIRDFDEHVMAPNCGFSGADDYYYRVASARVVDRIAVPAFVLHAVDDPFIRLLPRTRELLLANPHVEFIETPHGGHCAFLAPAVGYDGYWAEHCLFSFIQSQAGS